MNTPSLRELALQIFRGALADCGIEQAFARRLQVTSEGKGAQLRFEDQTIDLAGIRHLRIVSVGKAASEMLHALLLRLPLPAGCDLSGVLIARERPSHLPEGFSFFAGGHPLPSEGSLNGARAALELLNRTAGMVEAGEESLCLFLVSGGASAMMELPLDPAISLEDTIRFHRELVHSGASITEINCIRKHFSAIKGGRLALAAGRARCVSLLVSDVPAGHLDALGSGPTLPDVTTIAQCYELLERYRLLERFPASVREFFLSSIPETPKPEELRHPAWPLLDETELAEAAKRHALQLGFDVVLDNTCDDWSYRDAAHYLLDRLRELRRHHRRICLLSTGEVTVHVPAKNNSELHGGSPQGGRNQHLVLYLSTLLTPSDAPLAILSAGSDGIDGNSDAAGAVIDETTLQRNGSATDPTITADRALEEFDSFSLLSRLDAAIVTGPTGNNLRDLRILLAES